jgi:hypothetical protein
MRDVRGVESIAMARPGDENGEPTSSTTRLWRVAVPRSRAWHETFLRLAASTPEGHMLSPAFHGNVLSFNAQPSAREAARLVKDLMVQTNFALEHEGCGGITTYVGETRISMTCACGAEIARKLKG